MSISEIAHLRAQIELEVVTMRQGLYGLAAGTSKHQFIAAKMTRLGTYKNQLATHIGGEQATQFSWQAYTRMMEEKES